MGTSMNDTLTTGESVKPRLLTLQEAARYLTLGQWAVRRLVWDGELPEVRIRGKMRFDQPDLDNLIDKLKVVH